MTDLPITMADLLDAAAGLSGRKSQDIVGPSRRSALSHLRRHIMLAGLQLGISSDEIASALGRHRTNLRALTNGHAADEFTTTLLRAAEAIAQRRVRDFFAALESDVPARTAS